MRVLHVMESTIGGTRRHIVDVALGQLELGLEVHLVVAAERQPDFLDDVRALREAGASAEVLPMERAIRPRIDLAHARHLVGRLRSVRPDVVHTHSSKAGVLGRHASLASGIGRRVHTPHTFAFLFGAMFGPLKRRLFRAVERHYGRSTDRMVAVSESEAETIRAAGVVAPERVRTVPNGIDPAPWIAAVPAPREGLGVPGDAPLAAVVGLLNAAKGQDLALRALAAPGCEALHLLVVGHGELEPDLHALAEELGIVPRVHFLGWRRDVPALVAASDVVVLPSRWEGMPYVVLEAMAAARPVVATRVDGARDVLRDGAAGTLVPLEDPAALGAALAAELARPPEERAARGAAGRERVLERYSREAMVRGLSAVYEEVL